MQRTIHVGRRGRVGRVDWLPLLVVMGMPGLFGCTVDNYIVKIEGNDAFFQADPAEVDILLVIDNSGSMEEYQQELSTRFETFLSFFPEDIDYRIGVTSSTVEAPEPNRNCTRADIEESAYGGVLAGEDWIDNEDPDGAARFEEYVQVGICGGGYEMGLEAAYLAVTTANAGFRRPGASLSVVFVSDEEDNSPGTTSEYVRQFRERVDAEGRQAFNASALVIVDETNCSEEQLSSGAHRNIRFPDVATQTEGAVGDLCTEDFDNIVSQVSQASSRMLDTFFLSEYPSPGSLEVGVGEVIVPCTAGEWSYQIVNDRPAIVFSADALPPPGSRITASYNYGSGDPASFCPEEP